MSEIPFYFHCPTPRYFRDKGLFKNQKNLAFVTWCFERCSNETREIFHDNQKIVLLPYQFIFGRPVCVEETGLSEDEVRTQQKRWETAGFLKKAPNKTPNRFTIYEWVLTAFLKDDPQQNPRSTPNKPPTNPHNQDNKKKRYKEDHHPNPSSPKVAKGDDESRLMIDDSLSIENEKKVKFEFVVNEVLKVVELSDADYKACLEIKGSHANVESAIDYILRSPGRKSAIQDWPNALRKWKITPKLQSRTEANQARAQKLYEAFGNNASGWKCEHYRCNLKDQTGILFYAPVGSVPPVFVAYTDPEFDQKVDVTLREKKMQKGRIASS